MNSDTHYIDHIIQYFQIRREEYNLVYNETSNSKNNTEQQIMTFIGIVLTVAVLMASIIIPIATTTVTTNTDVLNQQSANIIGILQLNQTNITNLLLKNAQQTANLAAESYRKSQNGFSKIMYLPTIVAVGMLFFLIFMGINNWSGYKKLRQLTHKSITILNILTMLYILKVEYVHKLKDEETQRIVKMFYLPDERYLEQLKSLSEKLFTENEGKKI